MLERIKDCICHPRFIGKYNKDKIGKILFVIFLFFALYLLVFGVRVFNENPLGEGSESLIASKVISKQNKTIYYDSETNKLIGDSIVIQEETFNMYVLPTDEATISNLTVNIVLKEDKGFVYYGDIAIGVINYTDVQAGSFTFEGISNNNPTDIYQFRNFISSVLESSYTFFRVYNFVEGAITTFTTFMMLFLVSFIFARMINPTIEGKVRAKLVLYDANIFLVCAMLASLFNAGWIVYIGYALPMIYTTRTFKHIIRVVIPKK